MLEPGRRIGPYVVESLVGMGGMGEVYRAHDTRLGRRVALKVVREREDKTGIAPAERLVAEARAAAALKHPNVVEVYDVGTDGGQTYVAMEYIEGKPLRDYVGESSVPFATRKAWVLQIGEALAAAHRVGLVHRDVKPDNVLVDADGRARVLDFGIAKRLTFDTSAPTADAPQPQTADGRVLGTISYMAPEQLAGAPPDAKWDQFAWGVLAYELFAGVHPRATVAMPGPTAHLAQLPKLPSEIASDVPFSDAAAVMLAIAYEPSRRHASMGAALAALRDTRAPASASAIAQSEPRAPARAVRPASREWLPVAIAAFLAGAGGLVLFRALHSPRASAPAIASVAPRAPTPTPSAVVSAAPPEPRAVVAPAPVASARARPEPGHPDDYSTDCSCNAVGVGRLCPLGSDQTQRFCYCHAKDDTSLLDDAGEDLVQGRNLRNGMPCSGEETPGVSIAGALTGCQISCATRGFAGVQRTRCRGLDATSGIEREGTLWCF